MAAEQQIPGSAAVQLSESASSLQHWFLQYATESVTYNAPNTSSAAMTFAGLGHFLSDAAAFATLQEDDRARFVESIRPPPQRHVTFTDFLCVLEMLAHVRFPHLSPAVGLNAVVAEALRHLDQREADAAPSPLSNDDTAIDTTAGDLSPPELGTTKNSSTAARRPDASTNPRLAPQKSAAGKRGYVPAGIAHVTEKVFAFLAAHSEGELCEKVKLPAATAPCFSLRGQHLSGDASADPSLRLWRAIQASCKLVFPKSNPIAAEELTFQRFLDAVDQL